MLNFNRRREKPLNSSLKKGVSFACTMTQRDFTSDASIKVELPTSFRLTNKSLKWSTRNASQQRSKRFIECLRRK
jgi:hypothetical protein